MTSLLSPAGLARASARRPWLVVGGWLAAVVLSIVLAVTSLGGVLTTEIALTNNPESLQGIDLLDERMGEDDAVSETVVVRSETLTIDDPAFRAEVERVTADVGAFLGAAGSAVSYYQLADQGAPDAAGLVSADRHATLVPVSFTGGLDDAKERFAGYEDALHANAAPGFQVLSVGDVSIDEEFTAVSESDLQTAELFGLPIALLVLLVAFGALVAAGVPLALAIVSIIVSVGAAALIGQVTELSFFVVNMITMIGLAVGIDYALFIVERYREERRRGATQAAAIATAGGTATKAVVFSGLTVVFALTGMLLIPTTIFRSLGIGAILAVIFAVLGTMTLVPAMLALLGDRIDWPRRRRYDAATAAAQLARDRETIHSGFWGTITRVVMARPAVAVVAGVAVLGAMALPYFDLQRGQAGIATLPDSEPRQAFEILSRDFGAGRLDPVEFAVDGRRDDPAVQASVERLVTTLNADPAFAAGSAVTEWNGAGDTALVTASLLADGSSPEAIATIDRLREEVVPAAFAGAPAEVFVTGTVAENADFFTVVDDWTPIVFAFVLGLSFLLLVVVFRSVVIPVKAIALNLLSVGAAYGLMVLVFQNGVGADLLGFQETPTIEAWVPIFLFCVLFGLSMDYHVFLLSRIKEHYDRTGRNAESVAVGLQSTARIITGAALIMVVVFTGFAAGELVMFQQMGFGLAVAVALDATIVRSVLVPAGMALLGKWNWYLPSWLNWLPDLGIEGPRRPDLSSVPTAGAVAAPSALVPPPYGEGADD